MTEEKLIFYNDRTTYFSDALGKETLVRRTCDSARHNIRYSHYNSLLCAHQATVSLVKFLSNVRLSFSSVALIVLAIELPILYTEAHF